MNMEKAPMPDTSADVRQGNIFEITAVRIINDHNLPVEYRVTRCVQYWHMMWMQCSQGISALK